MLSLTILLSPPLLLLTSFNAASLQAMACGSRCSAPSTSALIDRRRARARARARVCVILLH